MRHFKFQLQRCRTQWLHLGILGLFLLPVTNGKSNSKKCLSIIRYREGCCSKEGVLNFFKTNLLLFLMIGRALRSIFPDEKNFDHELAVKRTNTLNFDKRWSSDWHWNGYRNEKVWFWQSRCCLYCFSWNYANSSLGFYLNSLTIRVEYNFRSRKIRNPTSNQDHKCPFFVHSNTFLDPKICPP